MDTESLLKWKDEFENERKKQFNRVKQYNQETIKHLKTIEIKAHLEALKEEKRRQEIVAQRKAQNKEATMRFQKGIRYFNSINRDKSNLEDIFNKNSFLGDRLNSTGPDKLIVYDKELASFICSSPNSHTKLNFQRGGIYVGGNLKRQFDVNPTEKQPKIGLPKSNSEATLIRELVDHRQQHIKETTKDLFMEFKKIVNSELDNETVLSVEDNLSDEFDGIDTDSLVTASSSKVSENSAVYSNKVEVETRYANLNGKFKSFQTQSDLKPSKPRIKSILKRSCSLDENYLSFIDKLNKNNTTHQEPEIKFFTDKVKDSLELANFRLDSGKESNKKRKSVRFVASNVVKEDENQKNKADFVRPIEESMDSKKHKIMSNINQQDTQNFMFSRISSTNSIRRPVIKPQHRQIKSTMSTITNNEAEKSPTSNVHPVQKQESPILKPENKKPPIYPISMPIQQSTSNGYATIGQRRREFSHKNRSIGERNTFNKLSPDSLKKTAAAEFDILKETNSNKLKLQYYNPSLLAMSSFKNIHFSSSTGQLNSAARPIASAPARRIVNNETFPVNMVEKPINVSSHNLQNVIITNILRQSTKVKSAEVLNNNPKNIPPSIHLEIKYPFYSNSQPQQQQQQQPQYINISRPLKPPSNHQLQKVENASGLKENGTTINSMDIFLKAEEMAMNNYSESQIFNELGNIYSKDNQVDKPTNLSLEELNLKNSIKRLNERLNSVKSDLYYKNKDHKRQ